MKDEGRTEEENNDNLIDGKYSIQDLVDLEQLRNIFEKFTQSTGFTIGFLDHPGLNILIATGWRDICTKFHRTSPTSIENCKKSNMHLLDQLKKPGQIVIEECDNGLVDCATPIIIKGKHIASLATGQLLLKKPDIQRFRKQAHMFGCDEQEYLKALKDIPVVSEEKLKSVTSFLGEIAGVISELGYTSLSLKEEALLLDKEISERKQAEDARKESEERFRDLFENANDLIQIIDAEGRFLYVNRKWQETIGYTAEEARSLTFKDIIPKDQLSHCKDIFIKLTRGETVNQFETFFISKDGKAINVEGNINSFFLEGKFISTRGIFRDITERKQAEEEIEKNLSLLNSTIESTADGILVVDREGKWTKFNKKFIDMWKIPDSIVESRDDDKALTFVLDQLEDPQGFLSKVRELYEQPEKVSFDVISFKDGRYFERYSQPQEIGNKILGRVWSFRDVTDRKKAEGEVKKRVKELENFYHMALGRETRMIELKEEIEKLKEELEKYKKDELDTG